MEIYTVEKSKEDGVPEKLKNLIISRQLINNDNEEPTSKKKGEIASIEIYHGKGKKQIPQAVKDLVIKNQLIESKDIGDEEPPPVKKKKI